MRLFLPLFLIGFLTLLRAEPTLYDGNETLPESETAAWYDTGAPTEKADPESRKVYSTLQEAPSRVFMGEVFSILIRSVVTTEDFDELIYHFTDMEGLESLNPRPVREYRNHTFYDRFYFKVVASRARLPDITPILMFDDFTSSRPDPIGGSRLEVTVLNPPRDFSGVLAERFELRRSKTTVYDRKNNILVFMADANRSNLEDFRLPGPFTQNFESFRNDIGNASMTYYAVLPKTSENIRFSYFNLKTRRFEHLNIPIVIDDDTVSTQSDLKPTEHGHNYLKAVVFASVAGVFFIYFLLRRSVFALVVALAAGAYAAWLGAPIRHVCIKQGSAIYLLPMRNATVFEIAPARYELEVQGHIEGYTKVKLHNNKIGWVKDEDTCPN